jgi:hypothetical protein
MRIAAAVNGQKTASELIGSPGSSWSGLRAAISQNGIERAKISRKNFSGDRVLFGGITSVQHANRLELRKVLGDLSQAQKGNTY